MNLKSWIARGVNQGILFLLLGFNSALTRAADSAPPLPQAELELPSAWDKTFNIRTWAGFHDNVLLGPQRRVESPYVGGGLDIVLWRMPLDEWEYTFLASGDAIRYLSGEEIDKEIIVTAQNRIKRQFGQGWETGASLDYLYFDQVFDNSTLDREFGSIQLQGHSFSLRPHLQKRLAERYRLLFELPVTRQIFQRLIDDHWEGGPRWSLRREYGHRSEIGFSYDYVYRVHDTREKRDRVGRLVPDTLLEFHQHQVEASLRHHWDEQRRWRTVTRLGLQRNLDNGSGYYDYYRPRLSQIFRYQSAPWMIQAEARVSHFAYDLQPISAADLTTRRKTMLLLGLRTERHLSPRARIFAQFEHERSISNLSFDAYRANNVWAGLDLEF